MSLTWHRRPLLGLDLETTGTDIETARIVSAAVVRYGGGRDTDVRSWVSNMTDPDGTVTPIPAEATAVHGWTNQAARIAGRPAADVVAEVLAACATAAQSGWPLVVMNAAYDLSVLDREAVRFGVTPLFTRADPYVLDPRVLDKRVDRYRRGGRTLEDLCAHYVVDLEDAHTPEQDAKAACAVVWKLANRHRWLTRKTLSELFTAQTQWALRQQEDLRDYFARTPGKEHLATQMRLGWPYIPAPSLAVEK
ncbi:DNA polymerase III subunit epsilon [Streptomyces gancidicus BKS 13-15]|uniref:DNA polymerase III subunit epsilon n=1 Tax=Streptomyces gancidicus BKS 13-15 TaxID=1284664 RepID=M3D3X7_STREZ|nr:exonuclease domain-containing protein [Streptomyces gancidicus]EMF31088.1 DNA polymerase III subunit epsilon [Streptomyces gancidicus BKS 13-15]